MNRPVVDEMFDLIVRGEFEKLENISRPEDAIYIRSAISTNDASGIGITADMEDIIVRAPWITPLFHGPKIHFTSASTAIQSALSGGKSNVVIDWSFSFDSNVAEKVRAYVNHEKINETDKNRVITLLKLKKEYSLQTDLMPFLFENLRLSRDDEKNQRPLNTIVAFKKLDYLDWAAFEQNPSKPKFLCNEENLLQDAKNTYNKLVSNAEVKNREHKALFTQVTLFELAIIWLSRRHSPDEALRALIDFCVLQLNKLPKYELLFAWHFLSNPTKVRFFGPLSGVSKDLVKSLRGMAWDMSHMRALETMSTASNLGSFFIPFFVSFDEKFSEILKQNQIQILIMDDRLKRMHSANASEFAFQVKLNSCMSPRVLEKMNFVDSEIRRAHKTSESELKHILNHQIKILEPLAEKARSIRR